MDITKDVVPMTSFRNNSAECIQHIKKTGRPVILTVNGRAAVVVQDAGEGIRQGLADVAAGRTRPAADVFAELRAALDIPR